MKNLILKWLGFPGALEEMALRALISAVDKKGDETWIRVCADNGDLRIEAAKGIDDLFSIRLMDVVKGEEFRNEIRDVYACIAEENIKIESLSERIDREGFVDEIVERIKKKQLS